MAYILKEEQKKALREFMYRYGVDAGLGATREFERTGKFGRALINWTPRGRLVHKLLYDPSWDVPSKEDMERLPIDTDDWEWEDWCALDQTCVRIALYILKTYDKDLKPWEE